MQIEHKEIMFLYCNNCGKQVSTGFYPLRTDTPDKGIIVRAWIECPECIELRGDKQMSDDRVTLEEVFTYQEADENQIASMQRIRQSAFDLADAIVNECPSCADRTTAIRKVREAVMTANAAIVLKGMV